MGIILPRDDLPEGTSTNFLSDRERWTYRGSYTGEGVERPKDAGDRRTGDQTPSPNRSFGPPVVLKEALNKGSG